MIITNAYAVSKDRFPLLLNESKYCPKQLYAAGNLPPPTTSDGDRSVQYTGIAMIGTRRPGYNAQELCRKLVNSLRGTKAVIVSGLAQGIDSLCHEAALEAGLPTIAVLGQGLSTNIEGSRGDLAWRILDAGGAILSEYEPDEPAYKGHFASRNRIISGLSCASIIVQSREKGGALITGDYCRREKKLLFAVPGDFDNEVASGTNLLLDKGVAKPVFRPESLRCLLGFPKDGGQSLSQLASAGCELSPRAKELFTKVNGFRKTFDELQAEFHFKSGELLAILTELEIAGLAHTDDNLQFQFNGAA